MTDFLMLGKPKGSGCGCKKPAGSGATVLVTSTIDGKVTTREVEVDPAAGQPLSYSQARTPSQVFDVRLEVQNGQIVRAWHWDAGSWRALAL